MTMKFDMNTYSNTLDLAVDKELISPVRKIYLIKFMQDYIKHRR